MKPNFVCQLRSLWRSIRRRASGHLKFRKTLVFPSSLSHSEEMRKKHTAQNLLRRPLALVVEEATWRAGTNIAIENDGTPQVSTVALSEDEYREHQDDVGQCYAKIYQSLPRKKWITLDDAKASFDDSSCRLGLPDLLPVLSSRWLVERDGVGNGCIAMSVGRINVEILGAESMLIAIRAERNIGIGNRVTGADFLRILNGEDTTRFPVSVTPQEEFRNWLYLSNGKRFCEEDWIDQRWDSTTKCWSPDTSLPLPIPDGKAERIGATSSTRRSTDDVDRLLAAFLTTHHAYEEGRIEIFDAARLPQITHGTGLAKATICNAMKRAFPKSDGGAMAKYKQACSRKRPLVEYLVRANGHTLPDKRDYDFRESDVPMS